MRSVIKDTFTRALRETGDGRMEVKGSLKEVYGLENWKELFISFSQE